MPAHAATVASSTPPFPNWTRVGSDYIIQTFYPGVNRVTNVGIGFCNHGQSSVKFNLALADSEGHFISSRPQSISAGMCPYKYIDPQYELVTDPTKMYSVWAYPYSGYENNQLDIYTSSNDNSYANGSSFKNIFTRLNLDLDFVVFGYNVDNTPPAEPPADIAGQAPAGQATSAAPQEATQQTTETSPTKKITATTSNAAKNLTATYDSSLPAINLKWEASTLKNIDHYDIYKSNTTDNVFAKIGQSEKEKLTYNDFRLKYLDQYVYYVVGVSDTTNSDQSNMATVTIDDKNLSQDASTPQRALSRWEKFTDYFSKNNWLLPILFGLLVILIILLVIVDKMRRHYKKLHQGK